MSHSAKGPTSRSFLDDLVTESTLDAAVLSRRVAGPEKIRQVVSAVGETFSGLDYTYREKTASREIVEYKGFLPSGTEAFGAVTITRNAQEQVIHISSMIRPLNAVIEISSLLKIMLQEHFESDFFYN